ncbi:hypothetical protein MPH_02544 [Macrophomina phaseolina MS6]|uniref:Uncharacterized protein n=1 Tax=Macrophomina phaseolina (strain MS6) TaxID=1126212 RepID=K2S5A1_MACPH|nr:hypothetical protein MPH_02544 [Macrophomina phaseolina MS6]
MAPATSKLHSSPADEGEEEESGQYNFSQQTQAQTTCHKPMMSIVSDTNSFSPDSQTQSFSHILDLSDPEDEPAERERKRARNKTMSIPDSHPGPRGAASGSRNDCCSATHHTPPKRSSAQPIPATKQISPGIESGGSVIGTHSSMAGMATTLLANAHTKLSTIQRDLPSIHHNTRTNIIPIMGAATERLSSWIPARLPSIPYSGGRRGCNNRTSSSRNPQEDDPFETISSSNSSDDSTGTTIYEPPPPPSSSYPCFRNSSSSTTTTTTTTPPAVQGNDYGDYYNPRQRRCKEDHTFYLVHDADEIQHDDNCDPRLYTPPPRSSQAESAMQAVVGVDVVRRAARFGRTAAAYGETAVDIAGMVAECLPSYEESQGSVKAASCMTEAQGDSATEHPSSVCQFFDAPEEATTGTIRYTARQGRDEFSNIDLSLSEQDDNTGEYEEITFEESHRARVAQAGIGPHTRGRIAVSQPIGIRRFLSRRTSTREPTFPERPISPSSLGVAIVSERVNQLPCSNHHKPGA